MASTLHFWRLLWLLLVWAPLDHRAPDHPTPDPPSAAGASHNSPRAQTGTFQAPLQTPPKFHEKTQREDKKSENGVKEGNKSAKFWAPPPFWAPPFWAPPFGAQQFGAPPFGAQQFGAPNCVCSSVFFSVFFLKKKAKRLKHQFWPKSVWPESATQMLAKVGQLRLAKVGQIRMAKVSLAKVGISQPFMHVRTILPVRNTTACDSSPSGANKEGTELTHAPLNLEWHK